MIMKKIIFIIGLVLYSVFYMLQNVLLWNPAVITDIVVRLVFVMPIGIYVYIKAGRQLKTLYSSLLVFVLLSLYQTLFNLSTSDFAVLNATQDIQITVFVVTLIAYFAYQCKQLK